MLNQEDIDFIKLVLQRLDFLKHLQASELEQLLQGFEKQSASKGEILITEGTSGEVFYILASGKVGIYRKGPLVDKFIATLGPNSFFGEMSLISKEPRSASVVCEEDCVVYTLLRDTFMKIIMKNPKLAEMVRHTIVQRKHHTRVSEHSEWIEKTNRL